MAYKKLKFWFDEELAEGLADKISNVRQDFPRENFISDVTQAVASLELKERVELICDEFHAKLGGAYPQNVEILLSILGPENPNETGMFTEFYWVMPIAKYVEKYGINYFEVSMKAIKEITKRNTSEYAIRPYLRTYTEQTLSQMLLWSDDENFHVRRLASEGVRPRLPWASKLDVFIQRPKLILPILDNLHNDKIKYVQKSVANCLNDILKDNIDIGKELIDKWKEGYCSKECNWIIKHALRNLLKNNDSWAQKVVA
nr:DNA alkylation repair protein [Portibacter marinus]